MLAADLILDHHLIFSKLLATTITISAPAMPETRANVSHKLDAWYWAHVVIKPDGYAYCVCVKNCTKKWKNCYFTSENKKAV